MVAPWDWVIHDWCGPSPWVPPLLVSVHGHWTHLVHWVHMLTPPCLLEGCELPWQGAPSLAHMAHPGMLTQMGVK